MYTRTFARIAAVLVFIPDCGCSADAVAPLFEDGTPRAGGARSLGSGGIPGEDGGSNSGGGIIGGSGGAPTDGGTSSSGGTSVDGGGAANGGTPGSGGNPTTGGAPDAGGAPASGGSGGATNPGGPVETPGVVLCGDATCDLTASSANACCVRTTIFASRCGTALTGCAFNGGQTFTCDDTSDCEDGQVCCSFYLTGVTTTRCETSCDGLGAPTQLCRTDAECGDKKCAPSDVIAEYNTCQ